MLRELATDAQLDRFRAEYEKVFRALKKSHDSEKRLIKKCRELNAEIVGGAAKVQAALKLSDEDQATITALKKEIENSWRMVDSSHEKVGAAQQKGYADFAPMRGEPRSAGQQTLAVGAVLDDDEQKAPCWTLRRRPPPTSFLPALMPLCALAP